MLLLLQLINLTLQQQCHLKKTTTYNLHKTSYKHIVQSIKIHNS